MTYQNSSLKYLFLSFIAVLLTASTDHLCSAFSLWQPQHQRTTDALPLSATTCINSEVMTRRRSLLQGMGLILGGATTAALIQAPPPAQAYFDYEGEQTGYTYISTPPKQPGPSQPAPKSAIDSVPTSSVTSSSVTSSVNEDGEERFPISISLPFTPVLSKDEENPEEVEEDTYDGMFF